MFFVIPDLIRDPVYNTLDFRVRGNDNIAVIDICLALGILEC